MAGAGERQEFVEAVRAPREVRGGVSSGVGDEVRGGWADRLWTHEETARWLHISVWTLHHVVTRGEGPPVYLVARRARRYDPGEVRDWVRRHRISPPGPDRPDGDQAVAGELRRAARKAA